ncbi:MAG: GNAT family N-acetyltransferase [Clostridia bacterium]|nr:GNAT family N-acetyltransferase [Clostridia bacterium]
MELVVKHFRELTSDELYEILRIRSEVFVVEQECVYQDIDGKDLDAFHVFLQDEEGIQAYLRVMNRGVSFDEVAIGRVVSMKRRCGLGTEILRAGIETAIEVYDADKITLEAQTYAREFYEKQGFVQTSDEFLEDGIPHIRMTLDLNDEGSGAHVFVTSSPCDDDVPEGVDLPCIFFEKNRFVELLRERVRPDARFVVFPGDPDSFDLNDEMMNTFVNCFEYHGMSISSACICDARNEYRAREFVDHSDVILLGGGHVPTQNAFFERIGLRELLEGYDGVIMGVSAGSMNSADVVYAQPELEGESVDPEYERYVPGLGLTQVNILPHYQKARYYKLDGRWLYDEITTEDSMGHEFISMPDGSFILEEDGHATLFGEGYRMADGKFEKICEDGEELRLY